MEGGGTVVAPLGTTGSPPSPGVPPVGLSDDHMEELLRFTLSLAASPLSLSPDYCSRLLQPEPSPLSPLPLDGSENTFGGAPPHPLYKRLARAIRRCIHSRSFSRSAGSVVASIPLDESVKMKESDWDALILDKGSELLSMFNAVDFELHVQEPFFSQLRACLKTVEGRCAVGNYNRYPTISSNLPKLFSFILFLILGSFRCVLARMVPGSLILFNKCLLLEVQHVNRYGSFSEMLQAETLAKVLPGVATINDGVQIYRKFYTEEKEMSNGVLAISVSKPTTQPYDSLAKLLSGLSYDGIAGLLGMAHTVGTVPDALPPPRSLLISSSMQPTRPTVEGCSLTDAARALSKHVNRSSSGWWGVLSGSESNKNRLALEVVIHLLNNCCWMNVHLIQPHGPVFEIRVPEGFGARWSKDGLKDIALDYVILKFTTSRLERFTASSAGERCQQDISWRKKTCNSMSVKFEVLKVAGLSGKLSYW
ncbi:hypothetical protein C4D60_Mb03t20260 [Musa balbisiana]|uniref:ASCH domain-containing protein n=1 Tax=Musa balbisiana TaxID=52838 RepID=A0A4S8JB89_MUSBA|nr:hypothetical protein C4D60_Mb03t20260 [Musa balbisiana]